MTSPIYITAQRNSRFQLEAVDDTKFSNTLDDYNRDSSKTNLLGIANKPLDPRTKQFIAAGVIVSALIIGGVIGGLVGGLTLYQSAVPTTLAPPTTTSATNIQFIGQTCNVSTDCMATSYCDTSNAVCSCSPEFYYDSSNGICRSRKGFGESCSTAIECEFNMLLTCSSGECKCDSMLFWNPYTHNCEDKRGLGESCVGASNECYSSKMVCTTLPNSLSTRCLCPLDTTYFSFFTGDCETKKVYGTTCSATFECIDYAWCTPFPGDTSNRCNCIPSYYYDSTTLACLPKKGYLSTCSNSFECIDNMLSLICVSNRCNCPTNSVWNGTHCDFLKPFGGICNKTADCLNSGTVCTWIPEQNVYACACPSNTYFSLVNNTCMPYKALGQICKDSTECSVNASCLWQSTTSDTRCQCTVSSFYQNGTNQCLFLKSLNSTCSRSAECQINVGLYCLSGVCQCDYRYYWSGLDCQPRKSFNSWSLYSQFCIFPFECKDYIGLTNCFDGNCRCSPTRTWNGAACV